VVIEIEIRFQKLCGLVMLCISCMCRSILLTVDINFFWWKADISHPVTVFICRCRVGNIYKI